MNEPINFQWRVTKYNPQYRDSNGHYTLVDDWICPSQIGETINGAIFTLEDYLQMENRYIQSIIRFMEETNVDTLRVVGLECDITEEDKQSPLYDESFDHLTIKEDMSLNKKDVVVVCKMILRNFLWCMLHSKDKFFLHFGWDYYMFIGSDANCLRAIEFSENNGLFVEECRSSYYLTEENITREVQWSEINQETVSDSETLIDVPLKELRNLFNLSDDHPLTGSFCIEKEHAAFFQEFLDHEMDFSKYEYYFWGGY